MNNFDAGASGNGNGSVPGGKRKREQEEQKYFHSERESPSSSDQFLRQLDASGLLSGSGECSNVTCSNPNLLSLGNYPLVNAEARAPFTFQNYTSLPTGNTNDATGGVPESYSLVANPFLSATSWNNTNKSDQQAGGLLSQAAAAISTSSSLLEPTPLDVLRAAPSSQYQASGAPGTSQSVTCQQQFASYMNLSSPIMVGDPLRGGNRSVDANAAASVMISNLHGGNKPIHPNHSNYTNIQQQATSQHPYNNHGLSRATDSLAAAEAYTNNLKQAAVIRSNNSQQLTGRPPVILYMPCDDAVISSYQCLARKQMELFEANEVDVEAGAQGRNRGIVLGQVGIRCRHCAHLYPRRRTKSSTFYPSKLKSIYQTAQNMANTHLTETCQYIPAGIREELIRLSRDKKTSAGGGKEYWSDGARILGIHETETHLRFTRSNDHPGSMRGEQHN